MARLPLGLRSAIDSFTAPREPSWQLGEFGDRKAQTHVESRQGAQLAVSPVPRTGGEVAGEACDRGGFPLVIHAGEPTGGGSRGRVQDRLRPAPEG